MVVQPQPHRLILGGEQALLAREIEDDLILEPEGGRIVDQVEDADAVDQVPLLEVDLERLLIAERMPGLIAAVAHLDVVDSPILLQEGRHVADLALALARIRERVQARARHRQRQCGQIAVGGPLRKIEPPKVGRQLIVERDLKQLDVELLLGIERPPVAIEVRVR